MNSDIFLRLSHVMNRVLKVPLQSITPESRAFDLDNWDSINHLDLILEIENEFKLEFSGQESAEMTSVQRIIESVLERRTAQNS